MSIQTQVVPTMLGAPRGSAASLLGKSLLQPRALGLSGPKRLAPPLSAASLHGSVSHRVRVALGTVRSGVCVLGTSRIVEAWRLQEGVQPRFKVGVHCHGPRVDWSAGVGFVEAWRLQEGEQPRFRTRVFPVRPRVLRTRERPEGFGSEETDLPNLLVKRTAALAQLARVVDGGLFLHREPI